jgi:hypothetical protein
MLPCRLFLLLSFSLVADAALSGFHNGQKGTGASLIGDGCSTSAYTWEDQIEYVQLQSASGNALNVRVGYKPIHSGGYTMRSGVLVQCWHKTQEDNRWDSTPLISLNHGGIGYSYGHGNGPSYSHSFSFTPQRLNQRTHFVRCGIIDKSSSYDSFDSGTTCASRSAGNSGGHHYDNAEIRFYSEQCQKVLVTVGNSASRTKYAQGHFPNALKCGSESNPNNWISKSNWVYNGPRYPDRFYAEWQSNGKLKVTRHDAHHGWGMYLRFNCYYNCAGTPTAAPTPSPTPAPTPAPTRFPTPQHKEPPCLCEAPLACQDATTGECKAPRTAAGDVCYSTDDTDCSCTAYEVLPDTGDTGRTQYNAGAQFDCTHKEYKLSFLRQPAAGVKETPLGSQPKLVLRDGDGRPIRVDEYYMRNKAFAEAVILKTEAHDCLCTEEAPCQHQSYGVNRCYETQTAHGRTFCPAGTRRCVHAANAPLLYSKAAGKGGCQCGGLTPCQNPDSTCSPKTNYYVTKYSAWLHEGGFKALNIDVTPSCTASRNWDAYVGTNTKPFSAKENNHVFVDINEWCETRCNAQIDSDIYECPSSHCTCQEHIVRQEYACPYQLNHEGTCFCTAGSRECGRVESTGFNDYIGSARAHGYNEYTAQFNYDDLTIDTEGEGFVLRVCLKHAHSSQRKRVCADSQPFPVRSDIPSYSCTATAAYKNVEPENVKLFKDMDNWCAVNCNAGFCPNTHCACVNAAPDQCAIFDKAGVCCPSGNVDSCGVCNGNGGSCKFETTVAIQAPAVAFDESRDCDLDLPCKHNTDGGCLPKVNKNGGPCYVHDEESEANTGWGVGTWGIDDTIDEGKGPSYDPAQGLWGYNAVSESFHELCYCPAGTTDSTTRAKWQAVLRDDWIEGYEAALGRQSEILEEFDMSNSYTKYSLEQLKTITAADAVVYSSSDCSGLEFRNFTNTKSSGSSNPFCAKHYNGDAGLEIQNNIGSIKVMPGVKATLHAHCSAIPLAEGACNLETFTTDITTTSAARAEYWCDACAAATDVAACNTESCFDNEKGCSSDAQCISGRCDTNNRCGPNFVSAVETQTGEYFTTPGTWKLVFHQTAGQYRSKNQWGSVNADNDNCADGKCSAYSILDRLESLRDGRTGKFQFKQVWGSGSNGISNRYNVWKQSSNPWTSGQNSAVQGYEGMNVQQKGRYSYTYVAYYNQRRVCRFWYCFRRLDESGNEEAPRPPEIAAGNGRTRKLWCRSTWYGRWEYINDPVYATRQIDLFSGLHRSSSSYVLFDGVTNPSYLSQYYQFTNFAVGMVSPISGNSIPEDISRWTQDVKLYVWTDTLDVNDLKQGNNNLRSIRLVGSPDCKVSLFDSGSLSGSSQTFGVGEHQVSSAASSLRLYRDQTINTGRRCPTKDQIMRTPFKQRWEIFDDPYCTSNCRCKSCGNAGPLCTKPLDPTRSYEGIRVNPELTDSTIAALDNTAGTEAVCVQIPATVGSNANSISLVGTSGAELDFVITSSGKSCLATECDSHITQCKLDATCRPLLESALDTCDGGADDDCFGTEFQKSNTNLLFANVHSCVVRSECVTHYDWAKEKSGFSEARRHRRRSLRELLDGELTTGTAQVAGSGDVFSDTVPGLEGARQRNPEYEGQLIESTAAHATITVNLNIGSPDLDTEAIEATVVVESSEADGMDMSVSMNVNVETEESEIVSSEVSAAIILRAMTKEEFGAVKQLNFRKAVAKAASVPWSRVSILSISNARRRRLGPSNSRALSGSGNILVSFVVKTDSAEEGFGIEQTMGSAVFMATLAQELQTLGVVNAAADGESAFSFDKESIVKKDTRVRTKDKKTKEEEEEVEGTKLTMVWAIVISVLTLIACAAMCVKGRGSAKVAEGDGPEFSERKDVARQPGHAWGESGKAEERRPAAMATKIQRIEM